MEQLYRIGRALRYWFFKAIPLLVVLMIAYQPFFLLRMPMQHHSQVKKIYWRYKIE